MVQKKKPRCRNRGPLTIACHMKKSSMLIFALFLAALIFIAQKHLLQTLPAIKIVSVTKIS
jgi:predicted membrane-bound mannosyltransferase